MRIFYKVPVTVCISIVASVFLTGCGRQDLPESYGFYASNGSGLTRLDNKTPQTERNNLNPSSTLIIFDRRLSMAAVKPEDIAKVFVRRYIRFNVDQQHDQRGAPPTDYIITRADSFAAFGSPFDCLIIPIKGQTEMVEVKPKQPLAKGLYYLFFDNEKIPFGVGIGSTPENQSEFNGGMDCYYDVLTKKAGFSWDSWMKTALRPGAGNYRNGNTVDEKSYAEITKLDALVDVWKKEFGDRLSRKEFPECAKLVHRLKSFNEQDTAYSTQLATALATYAQDFLTNDAQVAVALANRALMFSPDNADAKRVSDTGMQKIKDWNDQQDLQKKKWLKIADTNGKLLAKFNYSASGYGRVDGVLRITERAIIYIRKGGTQHKIRLQDIFNIWDNRETRVDSLQGSNYFEFITDKDSNDFGKITKKAIMKSGATIGSVHRSVEGDKIIFTVDVQGAAWSPVIKLPDNYAGVTMENSTWFFRKGIPQPDGSIKEWTVYDGNNPNWPSGERQFAVGAEKSRPPNQLKFIVTLP